MRAQTLAALDNVEEVLPAAGMGLGAIVRMNTHVTEIDAFLAEAAEPMAERLAAFDVRPPGVFSEVTRLGRADLLVELEAFAAD